MFSTADLTSFADITAADLKNYVQRGFLDMRGTPGRSREFSSEDLATAAIFAHLVRSGASSAAAQRTAPEMVKEMLAGAKVAAFQTPWCSHWFSLDELGPDVFDRAGAALKTPVERVHLINLGKIAQRLEALTEGRE